ncbi:hypothetical protein SAMN02910456_01063 [Ruminococcaceae bacterium YRB3002]|nr:hypothetical protein SAMN02910456_01063 [Ruminococcaceae bacterium YRB3002]
MNTYSNSLFEWDSVKERINIQKHGIDFRTASNVFLDPIRIERFDWEHSQGEDRYITVGMVEKNLLVLNVVYTDRENTIRIISARKANKEEVRQYNEHSLL